MEVTFIGGGGHCRSLLQMLPRYIVANGYTDLHPAENMPLQYLGDDSVITPGDWLHIAVALGPDDSLTVRRRLIDSLKEGHKFLSLIAETSICATNTEIGNGTAVMHGAIINGAKIGQHCIINSGAVIEHEVKLGENCFIGPGAVICGGAEIGSDVIIGAGATVRNGVKICSGATVGMGAAVVSDITEPGKYVGVPAVRL